MTGIGGHHSARMGKDEWLTPPFIIEALGPFDLDPCSPIERPWPTAKHHLTVKDDGLSCQWRGLVYCNPPYGSETGKWLKKCSEHGKCIALIFARTETEMFQWAWNTADAMLFLKGRLYFHHVDGTRASANSGGPSVLVAWGKKSVKRLKTSGLHGHLVTRWEAL